MTQRKRGLLPPAGLECSYRHPKDRCLFRFWITPTIALSVLLLFPVSLRAQKYSDLPPEDQLKLMLTVLKYRTDLSQTGRTGIRVGLYSSRTHEGMEYRARMLAAFDHAFRNVTFFGQSIDIEPLSDLNRLKEKPFHLLIIGEDCEQEIETILRITSQTGTTSACGLTRLRSSGITVIVGLKDGKSFLGINSASAKNERCVFSPKLLSLALPLQKNGN